MKVFASLIKEIKEKELHKNDGFCEMETLVKNVENELMDEKYKPSTALKAFFDKLKRRVRYPMEVAIVGQFSSGKSTFLNALLGRDVLPTGITPVTSKVNFINYGDEYKIEVTYHSGSKEFHSVEYLGKFSDQRVSIEDVKYISLFAPLEMLRNISFVDTPGLNSQSNFDTKTTTNILRDVDGIIWLGLIDAVAKKSELDILGEYLDNYANKSICLLNQKDRVSEDDLRVALDYANKNYKNYFSKIIAISAKEALDARLNKASLNDSNMQEVLDFIDDEISPKAKESKLFSLKQTIKSAITILQDEYTKISNLYVDLVELIEEYGENIIDLSSEIDSQLIDEIELLNLKVQECIEFNSSQIYTSIKTNLRNFVQEKKSLLGTKYINSEYKSFRILQTNFDKSKMKNIYENLENLESLILDHLSKKMKNFEQELILWKMRVLKTNKKNTIASDTELSDIKYFASAIFEEVYQYYILKLENYKQDIKYKINKLSFVSRFELAYEKTISQINFEIIDMQNRYERDPVNSTVNSFDESEILLRFKENLDFEYIKSQLRVNASFFNSALNKYSKEVSLASKDSVEKIQAKFDLVNEKVKSLESTFIEF